MSEQKQNKLKLELPEGVVEASGSEQFLEQVRTSLASILKPEKVGSISNSHEIKNQYQPLSPIIESAKSASQNIVVKDIKQFVLNKNPKSDVHFATVVAYFYKFEASADQKKEEIKSDNLLEACRLVNRKRPPSAPNTLHNALNIGLLDKGSERGTFKINSVGENLVAMALPQSDGQKNISHHKKSKTVSGKPRSTKKLRKR